MNHFGEIAYLSQIARPDVAVIINIGTAHIEFLGTQEGIRQAKMEIVEGMTSRECSCSTATIFSCAIWTRSRSSGLHTSVPPKAVPSGR